MALFAAARRAASSSLPLLRASVLGSSHGAALLRPMAAVVALPRAVPFSSSTKMMPSSDGELLRAIKSEIKFSEDCEDHDRVEEIPDNFPFKINDKKGLSDITLTRTYQGEQIEVLVSMPNLPTGDEPEDEQDEGGKDGDEVNDGNEEELPRSNLPLRITISKSDGTSLEFTCAAYPDEIVIDTLSVKQPSQNEEDEDLIAYEGPEFDDLDENLQKAFHKYLELRGITTVNTNFLQEYMINKENREYLTWLNKINDFVSK